MPGRCFQHTYLQETHLFPSEMSGAACGRGTKVPAMPTTAHRKQWQPHNASQSTTGSCTDHTSQFYTNSYTIITNSMVKMHHLWTTFCQMLDLTRSDSSQAAGVSRTPAKQELPQSSSFSFLHTWKLLHSTPRYPLMHLGQPGVTRLDKEVTAVEGSITLHGRCVHNKLLKGHPKPIRWTVFPLPSAGPGLALTSLKCKYHIFLKWRY